MAPQTKSKTNRESVALSVAPLPRTSDPNLLDEVNALSPEEFKRQEALLLRKIDWALLPIFFVFICLNYLDRNALASARVQGIEDDLNMKDGDYQVAISVLFAGYIIGQLPSNMLLTRVRPSIYLPLTCLAWGLVAALAALVTDFKGLVVQRFFLGLIEAPYFPGALYILSSWYTKKELATRTAILYSGSLLSGAFGGLLAAGIQAGLDGKRSIKAWQWLFIIEGCLTVFFAILGLFILPDFPSNTRFLSEKERAIAVLRLERDAGEADEERTSVWKGLRDSILDYKVWLLVAIVLFKTSAASFTQFIPTVINTFGYSKTNTLLLQSPPYVFATIVNLLTSWNSDRTGNRCWHICVPMVFAVIGYVIAAATISTGPRYLSVFLGLGGVYASYVPALAWVSSTIPRPKSKRASSYAIVNMVAQLAQIYSPYIYADKYKPRFIPAMSCNAGFSFLTIGAALILRHCLIKENKVLEELDLLTKDQDGVLSAVSAGRAQPNSSSNLKKEDDKVRKAENPQITKPVVSEAFQHSNQDTEAEATEVARPRSRKTEFRYAL